MTVNVVLDEGAIMPTKAYKEDAGFDLYVPENGPDMFVINGGDSALIETGVHMVIPIGYVGMIKSKSGLNVKDGILCEGVIDAGYTGSIRVKVYNHSNNTKVFLKGEKLTQIVILPIPEVELNLAYKMEDTERGDGGFGSTGK